MARSREDSLRAILKVKDWSSEQQKHEALVDHLQVGLYRFGGPRPGLKYLQVYCCGGEGREFGEFYKGKGHQAFLWDVIETIENNLSNKCYHFL